jgi:hypothetical protein
VLDRVKELVGSDVHGPVLRMARRADLSGEIGDDRVFHTVQEAVATMRANPDPEEPG